MKLTKSVLGLLLAVCASSALAQGKQTSKPSGQAAKSRPTLEKKTAASSEQGVGNDTNASNVRPNSTSPSAGKLADALTDTVQSQQPDSGADYIPCRFTSAELRSLIVPEDVLTLSPSDAESLVQRVFATIEQQQAAGAITPSVRDELLRTITSSELVSLTPSQALNKIIIHVQTAESKSAGVTVESSNPQTAKGAEPIVDSARKAIEKLARPVDVGCAMSVLSYKETSKAYGYIIANTYIAVQIVVRNLNRNQQFVLHDVELAVNTDPAGRIGRFYSGRDKLVVRALAAASGSFDPRNVAVHSAQGLGAVLSTLVPVFGGPVGDAAAVYTGGFFPSLDKVWKDLSTEQLNLLNDTGFSSSSSSQTVVPKTGTVMFVTFVPSLQFEQGWWTQDCASASALGTITSRQIKAIVPLHTGDPVETSAPNVDVAEAHRLCSYFSTLPQKQQRQLLKAQFAKIPSEMEAVPDGTILSIPGRKKYKKWSGNSVAIFEELSTAVVAGMHVIDDKDLEVSVAGLDCDKDSVTGVIKWPSPDTGTLTCKVSGKNLDKVNLLRLRNPTDTFYGEGAVGVSGGDNTTATVTFKTDSLHLLSKADYTVEIVSKNGVESSTKQIAHLDPQPFVTSSDPATLDLSKITSVQQMTIKGFRLDGTKEVDVQTPAGKAVLPIAAAPVPRDTQISVALDPYELKKLGTTAADINWTLVSAGGSITKISAPLKFLPAVSAKPAAAVAPVTP